MPLKENYENKAQGLMRIIQINKEIENFFDENNKGNVFQVAKFFEWKKIKLLQYQYIEASRDYLKGLPYTSETVHQVNQSLGSLNILYYRYNMSYVYADYCLKTNIYKIGIVDEDGSVKFLGTLSFDDIMILKMANNSKF